MKNNNVTKINRHDNKTGLNAFVDIEGEIKPNTIYKIKIINNKINVLHSTTTKPNPQD